MVSRLEDAAESAKFLSVGLIFILDCSLSLFLLGHEIHVLLAKPPNNCLQEHFLRS